MDIQAVRNGLKANAATIAGLKTWAWLPDSVVPPVFYTADLLIEFDRAFAHGLDDLIVTCRVLVSKADDRAGQAKLDGYMRGSGLTSVKAALESDRTLGGACDDVHVMRVLGFGLYQHQGVDYMGAEWITHVIGGG